MIDQRLGHGPNNALGYNAGAWYLKKRPAGHKMQRTLSNLCRSCQGCWVKVEARDQFRNRNGYPLKRDIAAFKLERIRSSERAKSPISSCDSIPTLTGVSRSPLLMLSATCLKRRMGRVIIRTSTEETRIPPRRIAA